MAIEPRRGCGYRKVGGLYLVSGGEPAPCGRLPFELHVCPACNAGIKQTRGWQWVRPPILLANGAPCRGAGECHICPLEEHNMPALAGLIWIGEKFYPTADAFLREARELGISRRIQSIPRNFKLGVTWVLLAHPKAIVRAPETEDELAEANRGDLSGNAHMLRIVRKGIVRVFRPTAIEKIVTATEARDQAAMQELAARDITPVVVPDDDRDHQGSVHDDPQMELE